VNGENPISFCNVFFVSQAIVGLSALLTSRRGLRRQLGSLAVISQTPRFALVLPGQSDRPPGR